MTKRHFEIVAESIRKIKNRDERWLVADSLADVFLLENPRFNRTLFLQACDTDID